MTRRLFWVALGATAGVLVVRRASRAAERLTPAGVQDGVANALAGLSASVSDFAAEMRVHMAEREAELRSGLGLDGSNDDIDAHTYVQGPDRP